MHDYAKALKIIKTRTCGNEPWRAVISYCCMRGHRVKEQSSRLSISNFQAYTHTRWSRFLLSWAFFSPFTTRQVVHHRHHVKPADAIDVNPRCDNVIELSTAATTRVVVIYVLSCARSTDKLLKYPYIQNSYYGLALSLLSTCGVSLTLHR